MTIKTVCEKGLLLFSNRFPENTPLSIIGRKIDSLPPTHAIGWAMLQSPAAQTVIEPKSEKRKINLQITRFIWSYCSEMGLEPFLSLITILIICF